MRTLNRVPAVLFAASFVLLAIGCRTARGPEPDPMDAERASRSRIERLERMEQIEAEAQSAEPVAVPTMPETRESPPVRSFAVPEDAVPGKLPVSRRAAVEAPVAKPLAKPVTKPAPKPVAKAEPKKAATGKRDSDSDSGSAVVAGGGRSGGDPDQATAGLADVAAGTQTTGPGTIPFSGPGARGFLIVGLVVAIFAALGAYAVWRLREGSRAPP